MENEYAFQDAKQQNKEGQVLDKPIQSTMKHQEGSGMTFLMFFILYSIFFSMFFLS